MGPGNRVVLSRRGLAGNSAAGRGCCSLGSAELVQQALTNGVSRSDRQPPERVATTRFGCRGYFGPSVIISDCATRASAAIFGSNLFCHCESPPCAGSASTLSTYQNRIADDGKAHDTTIVSWLPAPCATGVPPVPEHGQDGRGTSIVAAPPRCATDIRRTFCPLRSRGRYTFCPFRSRRGRVCEIRISLWNRIV